VSDAFEQVEKAENDAFQAMEDMNRARSHERALIQQANEMAKKHNLDKVKQEYEARIKAAMQETGSAENRVMVAMQKSRKAWKQYRESSCPSILE